jgi:VanZ family protein
MNRNLILKWTPALAMMSVIFWVSAQPGNELPSFDWADHIVKKAGHVVGYALLAGAYWYGLGMKRERRWLAWVLAVLYAATDEFHQSFVPGRNASVWDVVIFDNLGALIGVWLANRIVQQKQPAETA